MAAITITRGICSNCLAQCGAIFHAKDGKLVKVEGDAGNPISRGFICRKGKATSEILYDPERITHPLKRAGKRGEGKWKQISWDEALEEIAYNLNEAREKYGPESFVMGSGISSILLGFNWYIGLFLHLFGSPNHLRVSHLCVMPAALGGYYTCGFHMFNPDFANARCIAVWATNPDMSDPSKARDIRHAVARGAKLLVIDPRRTELASQAHVWMQLRPGTDAALALAMQNVIINEGLYDSEFVESQTYGFDKLRQHVQDFTPEKAEDITWVPAGFIREAARMWAQNKPGCVVVGPGGFVQHPNSLQMNRAVTTLVALTGSLDVAGGNRHLLSPLGRRSVMAGESDRPFNLLSPEQVSKRIGIDRLRVLRETGTHMAHPALVWRTMLEGKPYPLRAFLAMSGNVLLSVENSSLAREALSTVPFFALAGLQMSPTAAMADIVLPAAHWAETPQIVELGNWVFCHENAAEPLPDCRDDRDILIDLARRLGLEGFWTSREQSLNYRLESLKMTWDQFKDMGMYERRVEDKKYEKLGFQTPSKKVEFYSNTLERLGYDPLPTHHEPPESPVSRPALAEDYPLILITGIRNINRCLTYNVDSLKNFYPDPLIEIHPDTAKQLCIEDGDWVRIETPRGSIRQKAKLFDGISPRVVAAPYGFWHSGPDGWREMNINVLTDSDNLGPEVGSSSLKALMCKVSRE
ncbi:MAG: molybdopterin-dependent oxidoreductase [Pseudomonadota bacterium]